MRDINALHPRLQEKINQLMELCRKNGITIGITECLRTAAEQDALYAKGRTAGGSIVTNCRGSSYSSMHQWGVAFDFCLRMDVDGDGKTSDDTYNDATGLFVKVGKLGQSIGLEWGGSWRSPVDKPHFQLPDWGSTASKLKSQYGTPTRFMSTWSKQAASKPQASAGAPTTQNNGDGSAVATSESGLIIRETPSTKAARVGAIPYKGVCSLKKANVAIADGHTWALVYYSGMQGYCSQKYLDITKNPSTASTTTNASNTTSGPTYSKSTADSAQSKDPKYSGSYKTTANLNLRTGAGMNKDVILTIPKGDKVQNYSFYTNVNGTTWLLVEYGKYVGFVSASYLSKQ